jgi:hypothetical protein
LRLDVSVSGGELTVDIPPPFGLLRFHATGKTSFSSRDVALRFVEENGVKAMILSMIEGEVKAVRKR